MASERAYRMDVGARRFGRTLLGGSPLKLFRLTDAGNDVIDNIAAGRVVAESRLIASLLDAGVIHPVDLPGSTPRFTSDDVTIVIPALGHVEAVAAGSIVVDDGSHPPIEQATIRLDHNRGPAAARNAGLALVDTPLVAFVDTDVALGADWLALLLPAFDDDRIALVAPRVEGAPGSTRLARYEAANSPLDLGADRARVRVGTKVSYVPAAAIVCRSDAIRDIGGFDESLRYGEDVDLVWRLDRAGWRCRYEPAAVVLHMPRSSWPQWVRQRIAYGSSAAPLSIRHPGELAPVRTSGWSVGVWLLVVIGRPVEGLVVSVGTALALVRKLHDIPPGEAFDLAWRGNLAAGRQLADAVRRVWWPLLGVLAIRSRSARRALLLSMITAGGGIRVADDVAYSIGVWRGMMSTRNFGPLLPMINSWPGKRPALRATAR